MIRLEVFFYSLEQIDRNLEFFHKIKEKVSDCQTEKQKKILEFNRRLAIADRDQIKELNQKKRECEKEYDSKYENLCQLISEQTSKCRLLFENLANYPIYYNFEELLLKQDETINLNAKVKIPREKYFLPFNGNENWEENLDDERYQKDMNEVWMAQEHGFEKYKGAIFYHNLEKDPLQQTWVEKRPFMVRNLREVKREEKDGVLVEKIRPNAEKMLQNAIDKEILKFKEFKQGLLSSTSTLNTATNTLTRNEPSINTAMNSLTRTEPMNTLSRTDRENKESDRINKRFFNLN